MVEGVYFMKGYSPSLLTQTAPSERGPRVVCIFFSLRGNLSTGEDMNKMLLRTAAILVAAVLFIEPVSAVSAEKAIVLDAVTGRVLYEKNADDRSLIASTTKIMTALIICQQCNVLDRVKIPAEAVGVEGSSMYLTEGEVLTVQELLYGLMLRSGNDAAVALAIYCGGTVEGFVGMMNDKAHVLGLSGTHFENPNGLDSPDHHSTPRALAVLTAYAMENPIFAKTVSTKTVNAGTRSMRNHNKLLWQVEGADGVKTGFTKAAGRILVSSAVREGRRLIAVTINAPDDWNDHKTLLEEGFSRYSVKKVLDAGTVLGTVEVLGGQGRTVELVADGDFSYALAEGEKPEIILAGPGFVYAPVAKGQDAGVAHICLGGKSIGKVPLIYGDTVEKDPEPERPWWQRLLDR